MQFIKKYGVPIAIIAAIVLITGIRFGTSESDTAKNDDKSDSKTTGQKDSEQNDQAKAKEQAKTADYTYTAEPGDSYTLMARHAVESFSKANDKTVSQAQIIAAETFLTQEAGEPMLLIGDEVTLSNTKVADAIERAMNLSDTDEAAWETYVPYVDFSE